MNPLQIILEHVLFLVKRITKKLVLQLLSFELDQRCYTLWEAAAEALYIVLIVNGISTGLQTASILFASLEP